MGDPKYKTKIALSAAGVGLCLYVIGVFLPSNLRWFIWGVAVGLPLLPAALVARMVFGSDAPLKPEDVRRKLQSKFSRIVIVLTVPLGYALVFFLSMLPDNIQAIVIGGIIGLFATLAMLIGPALMAAHRASVVRRKRVVYPTEVRPGTGEDPTTMPEPPRGAL